MKKINLHSHTTYCDGTNTAEDMVLSAIDRGFDVFGLSGHSYLDFDDTWCMNPAATDRYFKEVQELKAKYKDKIVLLCGIEQDYFSKPQVHEFDYVIGSVHCVYSKEFDRYISVDYTAEHLIEGINECYSGDSLAFAEEYYKLVANLPAKTGCDIIGHFDLLTKFNEKHHIFDVSHPRYIAAASAALTNLLAEDIIFEVNTGAISRGYTTAPYPAEPILRQIQEAGGKVIISTDTHSVNTVDFWYQDALDLVKSYGFKSITVVDDRGNFYDEEI